MRNNGIQSDLSDRQLTPFSALTGHCRNPSWYRQELGLVSLVVDLDVSCMFNPWIDKPDAQDFTAESVYGGLLVRGNFSDAAGRYTAEWLVVQNSSVRTRLEHVAE